MAPYLPDMSNQMIDQKLMDILLKSFSELGPEAGEVFGFKSGNFLTTLEENVTQYERKPFIFFIFLCSLLASNLFTFIMRIYKNSITSTNTNIIITMNSYIYELYNLAVTIMVN